MKKTFVLFSVLLASSTAATLAFVNNVSVIAGWWRSFLAAGGDSASMTAATGWLPWLDWAAVDHSAVTTFIPMTGLWCMTAALVKIMRRIPIPY